MTESERNAMESNRDMRTQRIADAHNEKLDNIIQLLERIDNRLERVESMQAGVINSIALIIENKEDFIAWLQQDSKTS